LSDWIVTYDDNDIVRQMYEKCIIKQYKIGYSVAQKRQAFELVICKNENLLNEISEIISNEPNLYKSAFTSLAM
jgi:hypothetical protein